MGMTEGAFPWKEGQPSCKAGELDTTLVNKAGARRAQRRLVCVGASGPLGAGMRVLSESG